LKNRTTALARTQTKTHSLWLKLPTSVLIGIPLGAYVIRRLDAETFRRICMSFDAWVVGFGLSRVLIELDLIESPWAYTVMAITILIDAYLLYVFFAVQRAATPADRGRTDDPLLLT
jgi:mannitol-specific phosphotransferase system IIBC component